MADLITAARAMQSPSLAGADPALLASLISAASAAAERYCGRLFDSAARTEIYDGSGDRYLMLRAFPLTSVNNITVTDESGNTYTIATADLTLHLGRGEIRIKAGASASDYSYFPTGYQNISVPYTGGYVAIPEDIQQAVVHITEAMLSANVRAGDVSSEKLGDYAVTYGDGDGESGIPEAAQQLLGSYKDIRI